MEENNNENVDKYYNDVYIEDFVILTTSICVIVSIAWVFKEFGIF